MHTRTRPSSSTLSPTPTPTPPQAAREGLLRGARAAGVEIDLSHPSGELPLHHLVERATSSLVEQCQALQNKVAKKNGELTRLRAAQEATRDRLQILQA